MYTAPVLLSSQHNLENFDCGEDSLNNWLKRKALKNQSSGASRTFTICNDNDVIGYYCLSAGAIAHENTPKKN